MYFYSNNFWQRNEQILIYITNRWWIETKLHSKILNCYYWMNSGNSVGYDNIIKSTITPWWTDVKSFRFVAIRILKCDNNIPNNTCYIYLSQSIPPAADFNCLKFWSVLCSISFDIWSHTTSWTLNTVSDVNRKPIQYVSQCGPRQLLRDMMSLKWLNPFN